MCGVKQETAGPLQQHPLFGFALLFLLLHLLLLCTPPDPSRSVEIITVRLNSKGFRFSPSSLVLSFPLSSVVWKASKCCALSRAPRQVRLEVRVCVSLSVFEPRDQMSLVCL